MDRKGFLARLLALPFAAKAAGEVGNPQPTPDYVGYLEWMGEQMTTSSDAAWTTASVTTTHSAQAHVIYLNGYSPVQSTYTE